MKYLFSILSLSFFLFSCQGGLDQQNNQEEQAQQPDSTTISCEAIGLVKLSYSKNDLIEQFTEAELRDEKKEIRQVEKAVTIVFPGQPEEVTVIWQNDAMEHVEELLIWNENGPYSTKEGLRVGISLRDIVKLNNFLSVDFTNFYSAIDGYATITGFNGGELEEKYPCLGGRLDIVRLNGVDKLKLDEFKKLDLVSSSHSMMQNIDAKITEISIRNSSDTAK